MFLKRTPNEVAKDFAKQIQATEKGDIPALNKLNQKLVSLFQAQMIRPSQFEELEADIGRKYPR